MTTAESAARATGAAQAKVQRVQWTCVGAGLAAAGAIAGLFSLAAQARKLGGPVDGTQEAFVALAAIGLLVAASVSAVLSLRAGGPRWLSLVLLISVCVLWIAFFAVVEFR